MLKTLLTFICIINSFGQGRASSKPDIEFNVKKIPEDPNYLPKYRMEHAERNTSKEYTYWKQMDINFIEWPGNITKLEVGYPLVRWGKRAKLIHAPCNIQLGMDFKAYAYKYLHLTWGPFRITSSYCPPLKIPRTVLEPQLSSPTSPFISATDFEFVSDALLLILESQLIVRVGELEASRRNEGFSAIPDPSTLSYTLARGLTSPVTKLVVQNCCKNRMTTTCAHGDTVMALNEQSPEATVFISTDTGRTFQKLVLSPMESSFLHSALLFPNLELVLAFHGSADSVNRSFYSLNTGSLVASTTGEAKNGSVLSTHGKVQAKQIGQEHSIVIWDECKVWYSNDAGLSVSEALFYVHTNIQHGINKGIKDKKLRKSEAKHRILGEHCYLGGASGFAQDPTTGKVGLLDSLNNFFYGIDTKTDFFPLIGGNMDMSLLLAGKEHSVAPSFDFNNRPKLMYPPRYLWSDDEAYKDKDYKNRLGIKLFPRSVFPSDFMPPFFEENIPKRLKRNYGLQKCQTSSVIIDSSLTQKPKIFYTPPNTQFNFTVEFKSGKDELGQLNWEPKMDKHLQVTSTLLDFMRLGLKEYFYFKYNVTVLPQPIAFQGNLFRLNFFTTKSVRCVHQPQVTIWVKIENGGAHAENLKTFTGDPEPVKELKNFLNASSLRKVRHEKNPMTINQCSRKSN